MSDPPNLPDLRIRIVFDADRGMLGPGKADLLTLIEETGSIAAAGRRLGMSYKRAWSLVETMNDMFQSPLVESSRGGAGHGGARLTATGRQVLESYRTVCARAAKGAARNLAALEALTRPKTGRRTGDIARRK